MKRYILVLIFFLAVTVGLAQFISPSKVLADTLTANTSDLDNATFTWVDASHISASVPNHSPITFTSTSGVTQYSTGVGPSNFFSQNDQCNGNSSTLVANQNHPNDQAKVQWLYMKPSYGVCSTDNSNWSTPSIKIGSPGNANIIYHWSTSANEVQRVDNGNFVYVQKSGHPNVYVQQGDSAQCAPEIVVNAPGSPDQADMWLLTQSSDQNDGDDPGTKVTDTSTDAVGCYAAASNADWTQLGTSDKTSYTHAINSNGSIPIGTDIVYVTANQGGGVTCPDGSPAASVSACPGGGGGGAVTATDSCDQSNFSLSWIFCPFVEQMQHGLNYLNNEIQNFLIIPINGSSSQSGYFDDGCTNAAANGSNTPVENASCTASDTNYIVWGNMRDIAMSLLIIAALIMVISTALDVGPFDAYTVKKLLPRILIAVIAITFSWEIGRLLIQVSNDVGDGIGQLILSAVPLPAGAPHTNAEVLATISTGVLGWLGAGAAIGVAGLAAVGPLAIFMLLLPALLALAIGFLVLIARQLIVVMCVIFAPLAFIAFVIPGGTKIWKLWQQSFMGALFLFPMITAVISIGALMAFLINSGDVTNYAGIAPLLALILLIVPYFLIPRLARMSTGALGSVANGINGASQGLYKGLKQMQRNKMASSWDKAKKGDLYHGYSWIPGSQRLAKRTSAVTRGVGTGWSGHYGVGERGKQAIHKSDITAADEYMRSPENAAFKDYDNAQIAKSYENASAAAKGLRNDYGVTDEAEIKRAVEAARVSGGFGGFHSIAADKNLAASTTAYKDTGNIGDPNYESSMEKMMKTHVRASRGNAAIRANLAAYGSAVSKQQRPDLSPGAEASISLATEQAKVGGASKKMYEEHLDKAFESAGSIQQTLAYAKKPAIKSFANRQIELMKSGTGVERRQAAIHLSEMYGNMSSAGGDQRDAVNEALHDANIDFREGRSIYRQIADHATDTSAGNMDVAKDPNGAELNEASLLHMSRVWSGAGDPAIASPGAGAAPPPAPPGGGGPGGGGGAPPGGGGGPGGL